ncbi:hypothetical protein CJP74_07585, partial [Psittacicella melopsittaci]
GTSEEKRFIKHFKDKIKPKLDKQEDLTYYLIRNERVSELAIYSFNNGERFEPDYLLFLFVKIKKQNKDNPHLKEKEQNNTDPHLKEKEQDNHDPYLKEKEQDNHDPYLTYQGYIEPKGAHLIEQDKWKEDFLLDLSKEASSQGLIYGNYKIFGLPFYNQKEEISSNFDKELSEFIEKLKGA